jgi:hypothetical protein
MVKDKEKEIKIVQTSRFTYEGKLLEQIYEPETNSTYFLQWNPDEDEPSRLSNIINNDVKFSPIIDDLLQKKAVILPSGIEEYNSDEELEEDIDIFIKTWLDVSDDCRQKAVWYVMLSWNIDRLNTIPYLRALGDYGTGKTRYLDVIGGICYKPMYVGGSVRAAPIYRVIDLWRGTAVFDEFTLSKSDETEDIVQILNNGYQRGKPVLRCDATNYDKVKCFDPFGAKILATRTEFADKALESRCITEIMKMTSNNKVPTDLTKRFYDSRNILQNKLLLYRFRNWNQKETDDSVAIDFGNILPRIKQSLSPFTVLFQYDKEKLKKFITYAQEYNRKIVEENASSFDGQLVNAYISLLENHEEHQQYLEDYHPDQITASDVRGVLINDGWEENKINVRTVGKHLKTLGFENNLLRIGTKVKKVLSIDNDKLNSLKLKYFVTTVTSVTCVTTLYQKQPTGEGGRVVTDVTNVTTLQNESEDDKDDL